MRSRWHGPHHGAQKSTTTGLPAWSTSCSKLASVTSRIADQVTDGRRAPSRSSGTFQIASSTIARLIFEWPVLAVGERDRDLDDAEARRAATR